VKEQRVVIGRIRIVGYDTIENLVGEHLLSDAHLGQPS
jgi:hypothetical protein